MPILGRSCAPLPSVGKLHKQKARWQRTSQPSSILRRSSDTNGSEGCPFQAEPGSHWSLPTQWCGQNHFVASWQPYSQKRGGFVERGQDRVWLHQPMLYPICPREPGLLGESESRQFQELLELVGLWFYRLEKAANLSRGCSSVWLSPGLSWLSLPCCCTMSLSRA